jgi:AraC-like DNA-binding protein
VESAFLIRILYCAAAVQGLLFGILLARSNNNQLANRILSILLFLMSFHLVLVAFDERDFFMKFPHLSRISWIIGSLYWPLLFLFVQAITRYRLPLWINTALFLPFVVFLSVMLPYYGLSTEEKMKVLDDFEKASREDFGWVNQTISVLHILFQGLCLWFYYYVEKKLKEEYSAIESVRIKWLRQFLIGIFSITVVAVFSFFARNFEIPVFSILYSFHFMGVVFLFYWLCYQALTQPVVFGFQFVTIEPAEPEKAVSDTSEIRLQQSFSQIKMVLENDKVYKKPTLTLTELAASVGIARHLASQAINTQTSGNFFDLVNEFRIEEFKRLARDPTMKNLTMLGIAQEAGFNSKASFYAIFKKKTGMTPAEYAERESELIK